MKGQAVWGMLGILLLSGRLPADGTSLRHGGRVYFESTAKTSYGASYTERSIRASVTGKSACTIRVYTGRRPQRVFLDSEVLPETAWQYEAAAESVRLAVPAGHHEVQLRFDALESVKPFAVSFPVKDESGNRLGTLSGRCADEQVSVSLKWTAPERLVSLSLEGPAGLTLPPVTVLDGTEMDIRGVKAMYMAAGSVISLAFPAPGGEIPALSLTVKELGGTMSVASVDRQALFSRKDVCFAEGEAFKVISGTAPSISTTHPNTHGGGCIYSWGGGPGVLEWSLEVPEAGEYEIALVTACQEKVALRVMEVNGGMPYCLTLPGTGGWGRGPSREWQAWMPQVSDGKRLRVSLTAGRNTVRLTNLLGQHMNLDCIAALPVR